MKDFYLIDGYNVIFCMTGVFDDMDIENARQKLIDLMQDFGAHRDVEIMIVFDGQGPSGKAAVETIMDGFQIVFTPSRMTADSYIERESYKRRDEYRHIYVVTSDGPEQNQVLGNGAYRMAVSELKRQLLEDKHDQHQFIRKNNYTSRRNEVGMTLPPDIRHKLDTWRRHGK
jgi:predicted RNA-binding protein with PIN domain